MPVYHGLENLGGDVDLRNNEVSDRFVILTRQARAQLGGALLDGGGHCLILDPRGADLEGKTGESHAAFVLDAKLDKIARVEGHLVAFREPLAAYDKADPHRTLHLFGQNLYGCGHSALLEEDTVGTLAADGTKTLLYAAGGRGSNIAERDIRHSFPGTLPSAPQMAVNCLPSVLMLALKAGLSPAPNVC
jgi:hypothetical protein